MIGTRNESPRLASPSLDFDRLNTSPNAKIQKTLPSIKGTLSASYHPANPVHFRSVKKPSTNFGIPSAFERSGSPGRKEDQTATEVSLISTELQSRLLSDIAHTIEPEIVPFGQSATIDAHPIEARDLKSPLPKASQSKAAAKASRQDISERRRAGHTKPSGPDGRLPSAESMMSMSSGERWRPNSPTQSGMSLSNSKTTLSSLANTQYAGNTRPTSKSSYRVEKKTMEEKKSTPYIIFGCLSSF
eukprot:TRINITY_DN3131_c0_g1_i2.p1 TRINITY_DN3131_c0_g1~~TRINITY_DN3131_c0_g1_i2.p1  ORF type:complete len:245 (+),score=45.74 TRINITY_DN3131_c0_g1_i2:129-863(+)